MTAFSTEMNVVLLGKGLNRNGWSPVIARLNSIGCTSQIVENESQIQRDADVGILLGHDRLVSIESLQKPRLSFVLFHSSDLPMGRGWAPIYHTIVNGLPLVQSMLVASEGADEGPLLAKARYPLIGVELEEEVREMDDIMTLMLIEKVLPSYLRGELKPVPQIAENATWWSRRRPSDSEISPNLPLQQMLDHLRALPASAPPFFEWKGRRFSLRLESERFTLDSAKIEVEIIGMKS